MPIAKFKDILNLKVGVKYKYTKWNKIVYAFKRRPEIFLTDPRDLLPEII